MTPPAAPLRLGILASGRGSNLAAILRECAAGTLPATVALVISNHAGVGALDVAAAYGAPCGVIQRADHKGRAAQQQAMIAALTAAEAQLIICAGWDQILTPAFCAHYAGRIINVHPSLLPAFAGGLHAVAEALAAGVRVTGVTVHFVTPAVDAGPIILQEAVPVLPDDTVATLHARLQPVEHRLLPDAIRLYAAGRLQIVGQRVIISA